MQLLIAGRLFKYFVSPAFGIMLMYVWFNLDDFFEPECVLLFMSEVAMSLNFIVNVVRVLFTQ